MITRTMLQGLMILLLLPAAATAETFTMVSDDLTVLNHWPGLDGHVGNVDDVVNGNLSPENDSAPNPGRYSYNAFDFSGMGTGDVGMPTGYDAITFIAGTAEVDMNVAWGNAPTSPLFTGLNVTSGTLPFPSHSVFTAQFTNITSGTYDAATGAMTITCDFEANLGGVVDTATGMMLTGTGWVIEDDDFGTATGIAYIDDVLIPLAQAEGAARLLYARASGTTEPAQGFSWGVMPILAVIVALDFSPTPNQESSWGEIKALYSER